MTQGRPLPPPAPPQSPDIEGRSSEVRMSRRVSSLSFADDTIDNSSNKRLRPNQNPLLSRQVSHDYCVSVSDNEGEQLVLSGKNLKDGSQKVGTCGGRGSPVRCVSEFDRASQGADGEADADSEASTNETTSQPPALLSNPLHDARLLEHHTKALRLEADLHPMRLILSRLMAHTTLNRKGIFNSPVDPVALKLPDYFSVIKKPMDLGTIKVRLHAVAFQSRQEVASDIRLVFSNAMKYNPPHNAVHVAARDLLAFFEDQVQAFVPDVAHSKKCPPPPPTTATITFTNTITENTTTNSRIGEAAPTNEVTVNAGQPAAAAATLSSASSVHIQATRKKSICNGSAEALAPLIPKTSRKRKKRGSRVNPGHSCDRCEGRTCVVCKQGCLPLEPALLICNGSNCAGARIRKGAAYFVAKDGGRQFCQRCFTSLPAVLPAAGQGDVVRYKRDLLKRKNDEEIVERWLSCSECEDAVHEVCAMHDPFVHSEEEFRCPCCVAKDGRPQDTHRQVEERSAEGEGMYSFVCGSELPVKMSEVCGAPFQPDEGLWSSETLPECEVSSFIQQKIRDRMNIPEYPNADRTVHVRIISDCNRYFVVPEIVRKHFRMAAVEESKRGGVSPPTKVHYRSKAISLFQKVDGLDVCIFCMYVQEYDGVDEYENDTDKSSVTPQKRVYIAYLDSVEHFRPRVCRTEVYQEMLVAYLATARKRGYQSAHIWACPPSRGNSFVFWNHPASQRTPNRERLLAWYHGALCRAISCGVVTDVQSLYESDFQHQFEELGGGPGFSLESRDNQVLCPPLLDGDFWIEEAVRIHSINMSRHMKSKGAGGEADSVGIDSLPSDRQTESCPARQVASLLRDRVIPHESSFPFRRPVNAAAMNLKDYHTIVTKPMDLGTVLSKCLLGEYAALSDLVSDVGLVFSNAQLYNPKGHIVHTMAGFVRQLFFQELNQLVRSWKGSAKSDGDEQVCWRSFADTSMNLDAVLECVDGDSVSTTIAAGSSPVLSVPDSLELGERNCRKTGDTASDTASSALADKLSVTSADLFCGGPEAVSQRMIGEDTWLLDKNATALKGTVSYSKKGVSRRRKGHTDCDDEPTPKRRRQSWLGTEVGAAVRRMRTTFFTCSLATNPGVTPKEGDQVQHYEEYANSFPASSEDVARTSTVADARHSLLEFSQFRNLEFNTLRHAKYSTAIMLYHLHNDDAAGAIPTCTVCHEGIREVRWHKVNKVVPQYRTDKSKGSPHHHITHHRATNSCSSEELCSACFAKIPKKTDEFIPLQVSMTSRRN